MLPSSCIIEETERGAWVADCTFASEPNGLVSLGEDWTGTILSSRQEGGKFLSRIIGGKGGLGRPVKDRQYLGATSAKKIFESILSEGGETAGPALTDRLVNYTKQRGTVGQALNALADTLGAEWRVLRDGTVTLYRPVSGTELDSKKYTRTGADIDGAAFLTVDSTVPVTLGQTFEGKRIRSIRWGLTKARLEAEVSADLTSIVPSEIDYLRTYSAKVERQNSDGSLDLIVDGRFGLSQVPWLVGLPAKVTALPGDLVNVAWYKADPRAPYCYSTGQVSSGQSIARVGDSLTAGTLVIPTTLAGVTGPVPFQITYIPPGPDLEAQVAAAMLAMTPFAPVRVDLTGLITSGQDRIKC